MARVWFPARNETYSVANRATVTAFGSEILTVFTTPSLRDEACRQACLGELVILPLREGRDAMRRKIGMACPAQCYRAVCLERKERRLVSSAKRGGF